MPIRLLGNSSFVVLAVTATMPAVAQAAAVNPALTAGSSVAPSPADTTSPTATGSQAGGVEGDIIVAAQRVTLAFKR